MKSVLPLSAAAAAAEAQTPAAFKSLWKTGRLDVPLIGESGLIKSCGELTGCVGRILLSRP